MCIKIRRILLLSDDRKTKKWTSRLVSVLARYGVRCALPTVPVYCRCTLAERVPLLELAVVILRQLAPSRDHASPIPRRSDAGHHRAAQLATLIPATQAEQDQADTARAEALTLQLKQADTALDGIAAEIGQLAGKTDPGSVAIRDRLTAQFSGRYDQKTVLEANSRPSKMLRP